MSEDVFYQETLHDGQIICYRFISTGAEAAELWLAEVTELFDNWNSDQPLLLLIDLCRADNMMSAEMMRNARQASQERLPGKTAMLIDAEGSSINVKALLDRVLADARERRIFLKEDEAVQWLLEA